jgi:hypothetical protein
MNNEHNKVNQESLSLEEIMKIVDRMKCIADRRDVKSFWRGFDDTTDIDGGVGSRHYSFNTGRLGPQTPQTSAYLEINITDLGYKGLINRLKGIKSASVWVTTEREIVGSVTLADFKGPEVYPLFEKVKAKYEAQEKAFEDKRSEIKASTVDEARRHIRTI